MRFDLVVRCLGLCLAIAARATAADSASPANGQTLPTGPEQPQALLETAGSGFSVKSTPHFLIAHRTTDAEVRPFVTRVEQTYQSIQRFCRANGLPFRPPERKLEILFFDTAEEYAVYARRMGFFSIGTYGFYQEATNRSAFYNMENEPALLEMRRDLRSSRERVAQIEQSLARAAGPSVAVTLEYGDGRRRTMTVAQAKAELAKMRDELRRLDARANNYAERINRTIIQHETAHQVFFNVGVHVRGGPNPVWLIEGLATLFETPPSGSGSGAGAINQMRLLDFRTAVSAGNPTRDLKPDALFAALRDGRLLPLDELLTQSEAFTTRGPEGASRYAQAWALVHFLQRQRTPAFADYLRIVSSRRPGQRIDKRREIADFEKAFGPIGDEFVRRWAGFIFSIGLAPP